MNPKIKVTKMIHPMWENHQDALKKIPEYKKLMVKSYPMGIIGKWKVDYESKKGKISLINFPQDFKHKKLVWEIYAYENEKLFSDVERFDSKKEAEKRIEELLK